MKHDYFDMKHSSQYFLSEKKHDFSTKKRKTIVLRFSSPYIIFDQGFLVHQLLQLE